MSMPLHSRTGGQILIEQLKIHGVRHAFCVPGESYLPALDALYAERDTIGLIVARHDGGAAFMAAAYGKLTAQPGVCFVTRGPGATNASIAVHTAFQDSDPMILLVGQVASDQVEREAFQEIDYRRMFGQMCKWVAQIDRADRIPEYLSHAFHLATAGRPGPVVLALPEDMLSSTAIVADTAPYQRVQAAPAPYLMQDLMHRVSQARRPLLLLGGSGWSPQGRADLQTWVERWQLPVVGTFRFLDIFDNQHPNYIGEAGIGINPKLANRIRCADLVIALGARLGEMTTSGYTLLEPPIPKQSLIHIHADSAELGRVYQAQLLICSGVNEFASSATGLGEVPVAWLEHLKEGRHELLAWRTPPPVSSATDTSASPQGEKTVDLRACVETMNKLLPQDTIYTNGAGNFAGWLARFHPYTCYRSQLAPSSGAMGFGVPAAVSAQVAYPKRKVIAWTGDGDYLMNGQELATAVQYHLPIIVIVVNNGMYGTIRMHQERYYPARVHGTSLHNPDFSALARAYGAGGWTVRQTSDFAPALSAALAHLAPSLIEIIIDPEQITTQTTLSAIRAQGMKEQTKDK